MIAEVYSGCEKHPPPLLFLGTLFCHPPFFFVSTHFVSPSCWFRARLYCFAVPTLFFVSPFHQNIALRYIPFRRFNVLKRVTVVSFYRFTAMLPDTGVREGPRARGKRDNGQQLGPHHGQALPEAGTRSAQHDTGPGKNEIFACFSSNFPRFHAPIRIVEIPKPPMAPPQTLRLRLNPPAGFKSRPPVGSNLCFAVECRVAVRTPNPR